MRRRKFLTSFLHKKQEGFLPLAPYNKNRSLFSKFCANCVEKDSKSPCILACDEIYNKENGGILRFLNGYVVVDFEANGCKMCGKCAESCPHLVLDLDLANEQNPNWNFFVNILENDCLAHNKTLCSTCKDVCYSVLGRENAIVFVGLFYPKIRENCIGCGECIGVCPTKAIVLKHSLESLEELEC